MTKRKDMFRTRKKNLEKILLFLSCRYEELRYRFYYNSSDDARDFLNKTDHIWDSEKYRYLKYIEFLEKDLSKIINKN